MNSFKGLSIALALVIFFFMMLVWLSQQEPPVSRTQIAKSIVQLESANAQLNFQILYIESPQHENFDQLQENLRLFRSSLETLTLQAADLDIETRLIIEKVKQQFYDKTLLVDEFSANTAVIRSSMNFLSFYVKKIDLTIERLIFANPLYKAQYRNLEEVLFDIWQDEWRAYINGSQVVEGSLVLPHCAICPFTLNKDIDAFVKHLLLFNQRTILQEDLRKQLQQSNLEMTLQSLFIKVETLLKEMEQRVLHQQLFILAGVLVLVIGMVLLIWLIKRNRRQVRISETDTLTGLGNRIRFSRMLQQVKVEADAQQHSFGVLFIDLDGFKEVNDVLGHTQGDAVLKFFASKISAQLVGPYELMRFGGDEFVAIINPATTLKMHALGEELNRHGSLVLERDLAVTVSIGGALYPEHAASLEELIDMADKAMYKAKELGKNRFYLHHISRKKPLS